MSGLCGEAVRRWRTVHCAQGRFERLAMKVWSRCMPEEICHGAGEKLWLIALGTVAAIVQFDPPCV